MFAAVNTIEAVISAHNRPRFRCLYSDLKASQVNFPQRAIIDNGVHVHAAQLLIVYGEVLQAGADALRLNTIDQVRGDMTVK